MKILLAIHSMPEKKFIAIVTVFMVFKFQNLNRGRPHNCRKRGLHLATGVAQNVKAHFGLVRRTLGESLLIFEIVGRRKKGNL